MTEDEELLIETQRKKIEELQKWLDLKQAECVLLKNELAILSQELIPLREKNEARACLEELRGE